MTTTLRSIDEVAAAVARAAHPEHRTIVGITGAPGAGKSTIAAALVEKLGAHAILLPMDGFHLPQARLVELGRRDRMGAPDTFDVPALLAVITALTAESVSDGSAAATTSATTEDSGIPLRAPGFDRGIEEPIPDAIEITPEFSTVVLEGNYLLFEAGGWSPVAGFLDVSFYVDIDDDLRLRRLVARHERFGKSPDDARAWARGPDEKNARVIEATAARADYLIALP